MLLFCLEESYDGCFSLTWCEKQYNSRAKILIFSILIFTNKSHCYSLKAERFYNRIRSISVNI